ncbi:unnamed protein product [Calypogeia fissa]
MNDGSGTGGRPRFPPPSGPAASPEVDPSEFVSLHLTDLLRRINHEASGTSRGNRGDSRKSSLGLNLQHPRAEDSSPQNVPPRSSSKWSPWSSKRKTPNSRAGTPHSNKCYPISTCPTPNPVARYALEGLRNISNKTASGQAPSWKPVEARFDELASEDGMLNRCDFAACIGMNDTKEFAQELLDSLIRRKWHDQDLVREKLSKDEFYGYWRHITDTSFDSRMQLFFDLCDKDSDGCISEEEVKEIILLSASANKVSLQPEQAEEYAALIMRELDRHYKGYIELNRLETLMTPRRSTHEYAQQNFSPQLEPPSLRSRWQRYSKDFDSYLQDHWQRIVIVALWLAANVALYVWKFIQFKHRATFEMLGYCVCSAKGAAETLKLNMALILLPVCRNTITWLRCTFFGCLVPCDDNIKFHKLIAIGIIPGVIVHVVPHITCNIPRIAGAKYSIFMKTVGRVKYFHGVQPTYGDILLTPAAVTGIAMMVLMSVAFFLASRRCRKLLLKLPKAFHGLTGYNTFWYSHHLFALVYALFIMHGWFLILSDAWSRKLTWAYVTFPLVLYFSERVFRAFRGTLYKVCTLKAAVYPGNVLALHMTKPLGFKYKSGMYIFLQCPTVSKLQWHPFSITSAPGDDYLSVHVRILGDWTTEFYKLFKEALLSGTDSFPELYIDGPYGAPSQDFKKYDVVLLVGLGIGATPYISILKDILNNRRDISNSSRMDDSLSLTVDSKSSTDSQTLRDILKEAEIERSTSSRENSFHKLIKGRKSRGPTNAYFYWVTREQGSFEWFKGVINEVMEMDKEAVIEMHQYLTSVYEEGDPRSALITMLQELHHGKSGLDILSGTRARTYFARPNWSKVFSKLADSHPNSTVGVFYCGARNVAKELRALSRKYTQESSTKFEFHKENF